MRADDPIGVFDSGLGGLTVARAIRAALPEERLVYLGDTARVPYGTRSAHTVLRYARSCARHLQRHGVKLLVVACNTVSAVALPMLSVELDVPVLGVIGPGARAGVAATRRHRIGVIATAGTVASGAYPRAVAAVSSRTEVFQRAAPLLVPLVEEGWVEGEVPRLVVDRYLEPLIAEGVDALVLGCTHYPLLADVIRERLAASAPEPVAVVDSAEATARELTELLAQRALARTGEGTLRLMVTDLPARFAEQAARFLGEPVEGLDVESIDL
ncbi:MAG: glutamate racemase [Sandaracinaceae bacterium]|nr:glutamate racemase [Sandaracinaceae bacterium]